MASPVGSCPGDVNYTSGGTPSINDVRPARQDNVRPPLRVLQRKRRQRSAEVTCTNDRRYCASGVYAIAFAVHAALGDDVKHLEFDQTRMRNHLLQCFRKKKKKELVRFPTIRKCSRRNNYFPYREIEVFCSCLMPESYGDMIQCDKYEHWYHIRCVGLSSIPRDTELWNCHSCC